MFRHANICKVPLTGGNYATEGIKMPTSWRWKKIDGANIKAIHKELSGKKIKSFPLYTIWDFIFDEFILGIKKVCPLDYVDYNKNQALKILIKKYGYKTYPYKHYESVFTRFYQGFLLPENGELIKEKYIFPI